MVETHQVLSSLGVAREVLEVLFAEGAAEIKI